MSIYNMISIIKSTFIISNYLRLSWSIIAYYTTWRDITKSNFNINSEIKIWKSLKSLLSSIYILHEIILTLFFFNYSKGNFSWRFCLNYQRFAPMALLNKNPYTWKVYAD